MKIFIEYFKLNSSASLKVSSLVHFTDYGITQFKITFVIIFNLHNIYLSDDKIKKYGCVKIKVNNL